MRRHFNIDVVGRFDGVLDHEVATGAPGTQL
jgi:hypothetical protein